MSLKYEPRHFNTLKWIKWIYTATVCVSVHNLESFKLSVNLHPQGHYNDPTINFLNKDHKKKVLVRLTP